MKEQKMKMITFRVNEEQKKTIEARAESMGFKRTSEYIRCMLFTDILNHIKSINKNNRRVIKNAKT